MQIHDDIFAWKGWGGRFQLGSGKCRLRIFDLTDSRERTATLRPLIVLVSDVPDSPMSVRSCAGHIATTVTAEFNLDHHRTLFVEYYPPTAYGDHSQHHIAERYDAVDFTWIENRAIQPRWRTLKPPLLDLVESING